MLNDLYHMFRCDMCTRRDQALSLVLEAMEKHLLIRTIQISGSATLFYIIKTNQKSDFMLKMKRRIVDILLAAMNIHKDEETMMRNGCLALSHFQIPQDVVSFPLQSKKFSNFKHLYST